MRRAALWLILALAPGAVRAACDLDAAFGSAGVLTYSSPSGGATAAGDDLLALSDGRWLIAGGGDAVAGDKDAVWWCVNAAGALQSSGHYDGFVAPGKNEAFNAAAQEPGGGFVVLVGYAEDGLGNTSAAVAKLTFPALALDPAFGASGKTILNGAGGAAAVAVDSAGRIYMASGSIIVCMDGTGALINSFGVGGVAGLGVGAQIDDLHIDPLGRLVAVGTGFDGSLGSASLVRLLNTGSTDPAFGSSGIVTVTLPDPAVFTSLDLDAAGGVLATGYASDFSQSQWLALRVDASGAAAPGFGTAGLAAGGPVSALGAPQSAVGGLMNADGTLLLTGQSPSGLFPDAALWSLGFAGALNGGYASAGQRLWPAAPSLVCRPRTSAGLSRATGYVGASAALWGFTGVCGGASGIGSPGGIGAASPQSQAIAYPDPAKDHITFAITLAQDCDLRLELYDERGQRLSSASRNYSAGTALWPLSLGGYAPGVYLYRLVPSAGARPPIGKFVVQP